MAYDSSRQVFYFTGYGGLFTITPSGNATKLTRVDLRAKGLAAKFLPPPTVTADVTVRNEGVPERPAALGFGYRMSVTNDGPDTAASVVLNDRPSPHLRLLSASATQGSCQEGDGFVICSLGDLTAGVSVTVDVEVRALALGRVFGRASAASTTPVPDESNNVDTESTTLALTPIPSLSQWGLVVLLGLIATALFIVRRSRNGGLAGHYPRRLAATEAVRG